MNFQELDQSKREFFSECDLVVSTPITWYLKGSSIENEAIALPLHHRVEIGIIKNRKYGAFGKFADVESNCFTLPSKMEEKKIGIGEINALKKLIFHKKLQLHQGLMRMLEKSEFKVWYPLPFAHPQLNFSEDISSAFAFLIYCLDKNILTSEKLDKEKNGWRRAIEVKSREKTLDLAAAYRAKDVEGSLGRFIEVFRFCWLLQPVTNGAACFSSLLGTAENLSYRTYEINSPKGQKPKEIKRDIGEFSVFVDEILSKGSINTTIISKATAGFDLLLAYSNAKKDKFWGPLLLPYFFDEYDKVNLTEVVGDEKCHRRFSEDCGFLEFFAPTSAIKNIWDELKALQQTWIYYSSDLHTVQWDTDGVRILDEDEYRLPEKEQTSNVTDELTTGGQKITKVRMPKQIEINFSSDENYIKLDGKEIEISGDRVFSILEEIINNKTLHWSCGLVIFGWSREVPANPMQQFRVEIDRFNDKFGFKLIDYLKKKQIWKLANISVKSSTQESNNLCARAEKEEDPQKKMELLHRALLAYPNSFGVIKKLVELIGRNPDLRDKNKSIIEKDTPLIYDKLVKKKDGLKDAVDKMEQEGKKNGWPGFWKGATECFYRWSFELMEIENCLKSVEKFLENKQPTPSEDELSELVAEWQLLEKLSRGDRSEEESMQYDKAFEHHLSRPPIKEILNKTTSKVRTRLFETGLREGFDDIAQEVRLHYLTLITRGQRRHFKNMEEVRGVLIKGMSLGVTGKIIKEKFKGNLTSSNLRRLGEFFRVKRELEQQLERKPYDNEILKKLGAKWNKEKLEEIFDLLDIIEDLHIDKQFDVEKAQQVIGETEQCEEDQNATSL